MTGAVVIAIASPAEGAAAAVVATEVATEVAPAANSASAVEAAVKAKAATVRPRSCQHFAVSKVIVGIAAAAAEDAVAAAAEAAAEAVAEDAAAAEDVVEGHTFAEASEQDQRPLAVALRHPSCALRRRQSSERLGHALDTSMIQNTSQASSRPGVFRSL